MRADTSDVGVATTGVVPTTEVATGEVATTIKLCNQFQIPVVPQGGNTGLVLGSVPDASGKAIVLSLARRASTQR